MGTQAGCAVVTIVLYAYYRWQNSVRDKRRGEVEEDEGKFMSRDAWATVTDKENEMFRYCY